MSKKDKIEVIRARMKELFLNYCEFSADNGAIFVTYSNFIKIARDSHIIDDKLS